MSGEVLNEAGVLNKFGVPPDRIVDYLMLVGDTVDNVPGVTKVGPKTAAKWISEYGSIDQLIADADGVRAWPATTCAKRFRTSRSRASC